MRFFPKIDFLRRRFYREAELSALDKDLATAEALTDPGERLLRYKALATQSLKLSLGATMKFAVPGSITILGSIVALIAGVATANLPLAAGAATVLYGA